jgi:uncharacterized phiE125 gp8 family phage protein
MGLKRTVEPSDMPVTLGEAKAQCRVLHDDEDQLLEDLIAAATSMVEDYLGRSLTTQTWRLTLDAFSDAIILPRGPVQSIASFTYLDASGASQTVPGATYAFDADADPQAVRRQPSASWPQPGDRINPVTITYVAGYSVVPAAIRQAILMLVATWFANRETLLTGSIVAEMPFSAMALLENHRSFV